MRPLRLLWARSEGIPMAEQDGPVLAANGRTPEENRLIASLAAHAQWATEPDRTARTAAARRAFNAKFETEVDPDGVLDPVERAKRAENARQAFYKRLALRSATARRKRSMGAAGNGGGAAA